MLLKAKIASWSCRGATLHRHAINTFEKEPTHLLMLLTFIYFLSSSIWDNSSAWKHLCVSYCKRLCDTIIKGSFALEPKKPHQCANWQRTDACEYICHQMFVEHSKSPEPADRTHVSFRKFLAHCCGSTCALYTHKHKHFNCLNGAHTKQKLSYHLTLTSCSHYLHDLLHWYEIHERLKCSVLLSIPTHCQPWWNTNIIHPHFFMFLLHLEDITFPVTINIQVFSFSSLFDLKCN